MKYFSYIAIVLVSVAIIAGLFVVGSPRAERLRQLDERRVNDLSLIQSYVVNYWQNKDELPTDLSLLRDDLRGVVIPVDPETGESYGYEVRGELAFVVCADFATADTNTNDQRTLPLKSPALSPIEGGWAHEAGYHCFERTIDPDFYQESDGARIPAVGF